MIRCHSLDTGGMFSAVLPMHESWKTNPVPSWCVSILYWLLRPHTLTFPWINMIFYITLCGLTGLLLPTRSLALWASTVALCCRVRLHLLNIFPSGWHLDQCFSLSPLSLLFICICASPFFPLSALSPPSPRISQALWLLAAPSLSLSLSHNLFLLPSSSSISHLLSGVSVSARQGRPWSDLAGNELLITSQETRHSTPTHPTDTTFPPSPSPHATHTKRGKKKNKKLHSYRMLSPQREIVLERQGSRAEVQMKSV